MKAATTRSYRAVSAVSILCALACLLVAALLPVPYISMSPGPMYNTIGSSNGTQLIQISGHQTYPTAGQLDMTTVNERGGPYGGLTLPEAMTGWLSPDDVVVPIEYLYPPGVSKGDVETQNNVQFVGSQSAAVGAALGYLKIPTIQQVAVASVLDNSPASGHLQVADVIRSIDGNEVKLPKDVPPLVHARHPGERVRFAIVRDGRPLDVSFVLGVSPVNKAKSYAGITAGSLVVPPFSIKFGLADVGGPSAGLMFALGIVDKLTPTQLTGGRRVAGTGTITADGQVGRIGGITQKLAAARDNGTELFLAPAANCPDIRNNGDKGVNVVKVSTLAEAISDLDKWKAGSTSLPRCS